MAWLVLLLFLRKFLVSCCIFSTNHLMPRKKHLNIATFCFCRWRESNPGRLRSKRARYPFHHCISAAHKSWRNNSLFPSSLMIQNYPAPHPHQPIKTGDHPPTSAFPLKKVSMSFRRKRSHRLKKTWRKILVSFEIKYRINIFQFWIK